MSLANINPHLLEQVLRTAALDAEMRYRRNLPGSHQRAESFAQKKNCEFLHSQLKKKPAQ